MTFQLFTMSKVVGFCLSSIGLLGLTAWSTETFRSMRITKQSMASELFSVEPMDVSIIHLIATPERYHGKLVRLVGFVHIEFEGNAIYLHREDFDRLLTRNALWLSITPDIDKQADKYNDRYVLVEGTFNAENKGHFERCSGSIENIKRLDAWRFGRSPE
jgi:hypothetical protein